jgi:hypothetical protein
MLDEVRRRATRDASLTEKDVYVGVRYLLLQGEEKIRSDHEAHAKLERLFTVNQSLYIAYLLKEELRALWNCSIRTQAEMYLEKLAQESMGQWSSTSHKICLYRGRSPYRYSELLRSSLHDRNGRRYQ